MGGAFWVTAFLWAGYYFGNLPVIRANFSLVVLGIIVVSVLPIVIGLLKERKRTRR
jgi:membrane-associated protein